MIRMRVSPTEASKVWTSCLSAWPKLCYGSHEESRENTRPIGIATTAFRWAMILVATCLMSWPHPGADSLIAAESHASRLPAAVLEASQGLFVQRGNATGLEFAQWESETTATDAAKALPPEGGTIYFAPGRYVIRHGIVLKNAHNVALVAAPGVELAFPAKGSTPASRLAEPANAGQRHLIIDHPEGLTVGGRYQLFPQGGRGGRLLEFTVQEIQGQSIKLARPIRFMKHVKAIPEGSVVVEELNFVRVHRSHNVTIRGFTMDGLNRGNRTGHTTFSGIIVANNYHAAKAKGAPLFAGLHIADNNLQNLRGRGIVIYGTQDAVVARNTLSNIGAQAIEIDHFSSARVHGNEIRKATVGIQLNDAFDTIAEDNLLQEVQRSIVFLGHFEDAWLNTGNRIVRNKIIGPGVSGIQLHKTSHGNVITNNELLSIERPIEGPVGSNVISSNFVH